MVIWTAESNVAPTEGAEAVVKDTQPKAGENPLFDRSNNTARDEFLERVQKEIKDVVISDFKTSTKVNPIEKIIKIKGKVTAHVANRQAQLFCIGLKTSNGNRILKLHNQKEIDSAFKELVELCDEVRHKAPKTNKRTSKKSENSEPKLTDEEIIEGAKERIAKLSNGSKGIGMGKGDLTPGVRKWAKEQGYSVSGDRILLNKTEAD